MTGKQDQQQHITNSGDIRKYFSMILHMAEDELPLYEFRLYAHYVRVCGGGECYESVRTTASRIPVRKPDGSLKPISFGKVVDARDYLITEGWIKAYQDEKDIYHITIIDRWAENVAKYSKCSSGEHLENGQNGISDSAISEGECSSGEHGVHQVNGECSPSERKKNPSIRENQLRIESLSVMAIAIIEGCVPKDMGKEDHVYDQARLSFYDKFPETIHKYEKRYSEISELTPDIVKGSIREQKRAQSIRRWGKKNLPGVLRLVIPEDHRNSIPRERNLMFEIVLWGMFGVNYSNLDDQTKAKMQRESFGLINTVVKGLKDIGIEDPHLVKAFYLDYKRKNPGLSVTREPEKAVLEILAFKQNNADQLNRQEKAIEAQLEDESNELTEEQKAENLRILSQMEKLE